MCHIALKNPLLKPSSHGDFVFGIKNIAVLISLSKKGHKEPVVTQ